MSTDAVPVEGSFLLQEDGQGWSNELSNRATWHGQPLRSQGSRRGVEADRDGQLGEDSSCASHSIAQVMAATSMSKPVCPERPHDQAAVMSGWAVLAAKPTRAWLMSASAANTLKANAGSLSAPLVEVHPLPSV